LIEPSQGEEDDELDPLFEVSIIGEEPNVEEILIVAFSSTWCHWLIGKFESSNALLGLGLFILG
jgi:hypothetical protein